MSHKSKKKHARHVGAHGDTGGEAAASGPAPQEVKVAERRFPRIPAQTSVLVRKLGGSIKGALSTTLVVGRGGCCFVQSAPEKPGAELYLSILVGLDLVEARVRVAYCRPQPDGKNEIGVEFMEVAKRDEPLLARLLGEERPGPDGEREV